MPEERKLVTVLFADVTGSTALGEGLDPEDVRALMGRYYAHARRVVVEHGGTVEKFIGDAVMAVFGLPQAHSNDAERALAAALALRDAVATDPLLADRVALRMGVNTGPVVAATAGEDVSRGDFLVTGDAVNVAARLEQNAASNEILVSQRTASAAGASFLFGPARALEVKGKSQPLWVVSLASPRPERLLGRPALVGRERDLAQLTLLRDRALRELRPQMVSIIAPAGTGKTRLLEEFFTHLFEEDRFQVATARCLPYGQTLAYWPLRGLLEELLGGEMTLDTVAHVFTGASYSAADAQRLAELVLTTLGVESGGQGERETLFSAWRLLIEALTKQAPRIILFEDLHWASESLLDLVESVMRAGTHAPLMVVATGRPELLDRRPSWGGGRRNFTALALEPLTAAETRELVGALTGGAPEVTRAKIAERSGGNPFFAIEMARALHDATSPDSLPDTVQEAVQERLDALAPRERAVLQAAAVAGRAFRSGTLQAALTAVEDGSSPEAEVETALDDLLARDLIVSEEAGAFAFRHILIRDVAYNTLSRAERVRLHVVVARWLEDFAAGRLDEFVELIAYHYSQAAQLARQSTVTLETPIDASRAVEYLERAAALAFQAGALIEARGHLERAIALAPESERRRLSEVLGDRSGLLSDVAVPAYRAALDRWRAEAQPNPLDGARILRKLATHIMRWNGGMTPDEAQRAEMSGWRAEARDLADGADGVEGAYERLRLRAADLFWYWWTGDSPESSAPALLAAGSEAADEFEARGDWAAFSEALDGCGTLAFMMGDWEATFAASDRRLAAPALPLYERIDALNTVVWARSDSGDYAGAVATVREMLARRGPSELATAFTSAVFAARQAAYLCGDWAGFASFDAVLNEAWEEADRHPEDLRLIRLWQGDCAYALLIALAREDRGAADRARDTLAQLTEQEPREVRRRALHTLVTAFLRDDPAPLEKELAGAATSDDLELLPSHTAMFRILSESGSRVSAQILDLVAAGRPVRTVDHVKRWYAIARALADDDDAAVAAAVDAAEAHNLVPHAARMRAVLARRTSDRAQAERARVALERLGDTFFLRKLAVVVAELDGRDTR